MKNMSQKEKNNLLWAYRFGWALRWFVTLAFIAGVIYGICKLFGVL